MNHPKGFALLCDVQGNITRVLSDSLGMNLTLQPGMLFARLVARGGLVKALSFMNEIIAGGAAYDWELNFAVGEHVRTLHVTGSKLNEFLLIVAAENGKFSLKLYEEMMQMSNEQTNALRAALKDQSHNQRDDEQYDDISRLNNELVAMQRELAKKNAELEYLNQEKNRFLGMAAHDLRNPLQSILTHSGFLLEEAPATLGDEYRNFLEEIYSASEFMAHLVDDLLDVAKIESGHLLLEYAVVDLGILVAKSLALNRVLAAKKKIGIDLITDTLPAALIDCAKMEQVLNNLLGNAFKFSPPGSQVVVRLSNEGENFRLSVKDEGPGISEDEISRLFKPFQRGQARGTAGEKSSGLGLMIVKRIVEGHGGKIWIESQPGCGTTFFVLIPFQPVS